MRKVLLVAIFVLLVCVSCHKGDFSVDSVIAQPYVHQNGQMGLSLYVLAQVPTQDAIKMIVKDPSGNLTWQVSGGIVTYQGTQYRGNSDIGMPNGNELPKGKWSAQLLYKDGRTLDITFDVNYEDVQGALQRHGTTSSAVFDAASNLTVLDN